MTAVLSNGREVKAETVLVSIGRALNTEELRLEDAGLAAGKRGEIAGERKDGDNGARASTRSAM